VWPFCDEIEVPAHSHRCRKKRRGEIDPRAARELGRCKRISDRAQIVELALVRGQPLEQPGNDVLLKARVVPQPLDESSQIPVAAVKLVRLSSQLREFTARLCRLVAKPRDLELLLTRYSTKPRQLPVGCRPVFRHKLKRTKRHPLALGSDARGPPTRIVTRLLVPRGRHRTLGLGARRLLLSSTEPGDEY
jgi:hypothetical protein